MRGSEVARCCSALLLRSLLSPRTHNALSRLYSAPLAGTATLPHEMATAEDIGALKSQMSELTDALGRIESMALQASMNASKQHKAVAEAIERIEGMCMAQSTSIAKFEKKSGESQQTMEGMLMQAAMNSAKWQKAMDDRQQTMEGMLMQASMTAAKQQAAINKLAEDAGEEEGVPPEDDSSDSDEDDPLELDEATLEKLKAATYEKLAKAKGQTIEELKATVKAATVRAPLIASADVTTWPPRTPPRKRGGWLRSRGGGC
eukprot:COSAG01_NODE_1563_length_9897_cov_10.242703_3_plen_261_part_00